MKMLRLTGLAVGMLLLPASRCLSFAPAQEKEARIPIEQGIQALGGAANVAKLRAVHVKYEGNLHFGDTRIALKAEGAAQLPGKFRMQMEVEANNRKATILDLIDGDKGLRDQNGGVKSLEGELLFAVRRALRNLHVAGTLPDLIKDKAYSLSPLGEVKVIDHLAVGVKASRKGRADADLYFDKDNHLLVKVEWRAPNLDLQQEATWEALFSNYKETDGVRCPRNILLNVDGKKYMEVEVSEIRFAERIDDALFTRP
jgi:hypothetical protein